MNTTEAKVMDEFVKALSTESSPAAAFEKVCAMYRDEASAKWGYDKGQTAYYGVSQTIANCLSRVS